MPEKKERFKRVLLKLSGESLLGELPHGIDLDTTQNIAREIKDVHALGIEIAIMIGAGNIFRGIRGAEAGMDRASADYMGLLATIMNGIALQDALEREGVVTRQISAIEVKSVAEPFLRRRVIRHLEKGRVVIFTAGIGSPYFTTDTAGVLRALEINAEVILKATKVDGVYSADPLLDKNAQLYENIRFSDALNMDLKIMDATAFQLCREHDLPIVVFNLKKEGNIQKAALGQKIGTRVY
ncbi:UMP kinase [Acidobacteriota bacterium]